MTTTDKAIRRFYPEDRNCYTNEEFNFKHFQITDGFRYSIDNCFYESFLERVVEECKCIPFLVTWEIGVNLPKCR